MENKKAAVPFSVSTIFFILYLAINWICTCFDFGAGRINPERLLNASAETYLFWLTLLTMVVFIFIKKIQLVPTICTGMLMLFAIYDFVGMFNYAVGNELSIVTLFFRVLAYMLLTMIAIGSVTKRGFKGVGYIWFIPMILWLLSLLFDFVDIIDVLDGGSGMWLGYFLLQFLADIFYTVAFCLLCKWFGAVIRNQREALSAPARQYTRQAAAPTYAPAAASDTSTDEQLKKYQNYLMAGVITEEEYEAKRKQILGL